MTDNRETFVELITAVLLIAVFLLYLSRGLHQGVAMLFGGLILLGSGIYQTGKGWHVSLVTWILGLILLLGGLGMRVFVGAFFNINWVPLALLLVAAYLIWSWWRKRV